MKWDGKRTGPGSLLLAAIRKSLERGCMNNWMNVTHMSLPEVNPFSQHATTVRRVLRSEVLVKLNSVGLGEIELPWSPCDEKLWERSQKVGEDMLQREARVELAAEDGELRVK